MVVEGDGHADIMQGWCIALVVLDGIYIGMEDVRALQHLLRLRRHALHQIVVVGIHTGYHVHAKPALAIFFPVLLTFNLQEVHQHRLLTPRQIGFRRQHHLKIAVVVLEGGKHRAPEVDVVVGLDVGYNPTTGPLRLQGISRFEVPAVDIVFQFLSHVRQYLQRTTGLQDFLGGLQ